MSLSTPRALRGEFRQATRWSLIIAALGALLIIGAMGGSLLPKASPQGWTPTVIWGLAVAVLLFGIARAVREALDFEREWRALELLRTDATKARTSYPDSIVAARVRAVDEAVMERRVDREFRHSNRAEAATALAGVGTLTRFGSSVLLVLAVMGTFAGMKGSLGPLITAIETGSHFAQLGSGDTGGESVSVALRFVSEAFGSNFVALFGSLLLGLVAFGASLERRGFLNRLEFVSERWLYRALPPEADASELQQAVRELQRSVGAVAEIGDAVDRLGTGLGELKGVLRDTLSEMQLSFNDSVKRHGVELHRQLNDTVGELVLTLGGTTRALQATAVAYEGLVRGLEERDLGISKTAQALATQAERMAGAEERLAGALVDAARATEQAAQATARVEAMVGGASADMARSAELLAAAVKRQDTRLGEMSGHLTALRDGQRVTASALADGVRTVTDAVRDRLRDHADMLAQHLAASDEASRRRSETLTVAVESGFEQLPGRITAGAAAVAEEQHRGFTAIVDSESARVHAHVDRLEQRVGEASHVLAQALAGQHAQVAHAVCAAVVAQGDRTAAAVVAQGQSVVTAVAEHARHVQEARAEQAAQAHAAVIAQLDRLHDSLEAMRRDLVAGALGERAPGLRTGHTTPAGVPVGLGESPAKAVDGNGR